MEMSKISQTQSVQDTDVDEDALLAFSHHSGTELDYEFSDSVLVSDTGIQMERPKSSSSSTATLLPKSADKFQASKQALDERLKEQKQERKSCLLEQARAKVRFDCLTKGSDCNSTSSDVLDLQRMSEKFAERTKEKRIEKIIFETGGFDYEIVINTDKLLEEAHTILSEYNGKLDSATKASLQKSISVLKKLPHTYSHMPACKQKSAQVTSWLNDHANLPEPEMCGFTMHDAFQPRKFVSDTKPRMSTSDSNIILGKRKRSCVYPQNDDVTVIEKSSSDTRIHMHTDWSKPCSFGKRKRRKAD